MTTASTADSSGRSRADLSVKMDFNMPEVILKIGAEGGSITLFGRRLDEHLWIFSLQSSDCSDDEVLTADADSYAGQKTSEVSSWAEAVNLLNRYPSWYLFYPLIIHPDFKEHIFDEVKKRGGDDALRCWAEML